MLLLLCCSRWSVAFVLFVVIACWCCSFSCDVWYSSDYRVVALLACWCFVGLLRCCLFVVCLSLLCCCGLGLC